MSQRALSVPMLSAIAAGTVRPAILYDGVFDSGGSDVHLRLWTGLGDLSWGGYTWTGGGELLGLSPLEEAADIRAVGFTVTLSGMPSALISNALSNARQGRAGTLYLALMQPQAYLSCPGVSSNGATTPDSAAADITGDITIRVRVNCADWTPAAISTLVAKYAGAGARSYWFRVLTAGTLQFAFTTDGSTAITVSSAAPSLTDGGTYWLKVTRASATGAVNFYKSADLTTDPDAVTWTQIGSTVSGASGAMFNSTAALRVGVNSSGNNPLSGSVYYADVASGIGGDPVAVFDPLTFSSGNPDAQAVTGETWTVLQSGTPPARIVPGGEIIIDTPYQLQSGRLDFTIIEDSGDTCTIGAQYESRMVDLEKPRERRYTHEDQQIDYPGDRGFEFVPSLQDMQLVWGR